MRPKNFNHACAHLVHKESVKLSLLTISKITLALAYPHEGWSGGDKARGVLYMPDFLFNLDRGLLSQR